MNVLCFSQRTLNGLDEIKRGKFGHRIPWEEANGKERKLYCLFFAGCRFPKIAHINQRVHKKISICCIVMTKNVGVVGERDKKSPIDGHKSTI